MDQTVIKIDKEIIVQLYIFILTYRNLIIVVIMRLGRIPGHCGIHSLKYLGHFSNIRYTLTQSGQKHWKVFLEIQLPLPFKVQRRVELHFSHIILYALNIIFLNF